MRSKQLQEKIEQMWNLRYNYNIAFGAQKFVEADCIRRASILLNREISELQKKEGEI